MQRGIHEMRLAVTRLRQIDATYNTQRTCSSDARARYITIDGAAVTWLEIARGVLIPSGVIEGVTSMGELHETRCPISALLAAHVQHASEQTTNPRDFDANVPQGRIVVVHPVRRDGRGENVALDLVVRSLQTPLSSPARQLGCSAE
jgi:hypothetical protein